MSTQHPDNVRMPFFASGPLLSGEDEVREAFYAFSHLGCDEQMWDFEGKEVDEFVVEKLLSAHEPFFREHVLGRDLFLTPRVPNPRLEPGQAKVLLEVLHSLPRHSDVARMVYGDPSTPVFEVIYPMTTSAQEVGRIASYYARFVGGLDDVVLTPGDEPLGRLFGAFEPKQISVIPLIEEKPYLLAADELVRAHLAEARAAGQRVFIARSDPALNYGWVAAILLSLVALDRLQRLEDRVGTPIWPIIGVGSSPFRGNLRPPTAARSLARYPSVQTYTIQSAFKYDHSVDDARAAIAMLKSAPRGRAISVADEPLARDVLERSALRYAAEVAELAPLVNALAAHVPRRRMRRLHVGLFGYSRPQAGPVSLPRAITFCAALTSRGLPPEVLGLAALEERDWEYLTAAVPGFAADCRDAARWLDPRAADGATPLVREAIGALLRRIGEPESEVATEHAEIARAIRAREAAGDPALGELVVRAAELRGYLG
ncbi:MAG: phosphoenolpyruvate carboxylase [Chloroflexota bacterium]|nr:phosphoenolpyruvate carboxylase [Chloroflexota bacterium]